jgi:carnitine O-acetyltransferase
MTTSLPGRAIINSAATDDRSSNSRSLYNAAKANFDNVYISKSPIPYMARMNAVGYEIPQRTRPIFQQLIKSLEASRKRPIRILDIGCSYGINAALLRYVVDLPYLYSHYAEHESLCDRTELLLAEDQNLFRILRTRLRGHFTGIDASANAISYATANGLLDKGIVLDLEDEGPWPLEAGSLDVDLVISTGTVGYVGPDAFGRVLDLCANPRKVWIAVSTLCMIDFEPYAKAFADRGLSTERLPEAFAQRRFADAAEVEKVTACLQEQGLPTGEPERTEKLFANFTLSRVRDSGSKSLPELISRG